MRMEWIEKLKQVRGEDEIGDVKQGEKCVE